jgi:16S rRNA (cytidine1402-2'-O)-methyltransferase
LELAEETRTIILYVSPHKLVKTLAEFITYFERIVKFVFQENCLHEENRRGTAKEVLAHFEKKPSLEAKSVVVAGKTIEKEAKKSKLKKRKNKA